MTAASDIRPRAVPGPSTLDPAEVDRFDRLAATWWDPGGQMAQLHAMNPTRVAYVRDRAVAHFGQDQPLAMALSGLEIADIGCGGGLLSEPLARLGARVTGVDASAQAIAVARAHALRSGLGIDYVQGTAESMAGAGRRFDLVTALEVVEHVADVGTFVDALATLVRPGGLVVLSTLNRTARSFAFAIVGAEYVAGLLPRGTHDWRKFLRPSELADHLRAAGFVVDDTRGMVPDPLGPERWRLSDRRLGVNYLIAAHVPD